MPQISIEKNLLFAERMSDGSGYTWTLASRLGEMLNMAEELFGPRDCSYTILGIEFGPDNPRIWYPGDRRHIIIQLSLKATTDMSEACYQMAHETVHLLAPTGCRNANNFEEGVACYFAARYMEETFNDESYWRSSLPSYACTLALVKPRLDKDISCIRRLREHHPSFQDITKEEISKEFPKLTSEDVDFLMSKFARNSGS